MVQSFTKTTFIGLLALSTAMNSSAQVCEINGEIFLPGQELGDKFVTRCGSADKFPCFCNPDLQQQVECPYCGFALLGGDLLCARDGEAVSFVDINGDDKFCGCSAPSGGTPTPNCDISVSPERTCIIDLPDGSTGTFSEGESLGDFLSNRCGSDFPCYCNPSLPEQIECPYCRFASEGGDLVCARDGESVSYLDLDGNDQTCSCEIPNSPGAAPITTCNTDPNGSPTEAPVSSPTDPPSDFCTLELEGGQVITFFAGESYGDYLNNRCGSSEEFPCFCNPAMHNQIECPYCGFATGDGDLHCAKDQETISFLDGSIARTCSCEIPDDPSADPVRTCSEGSPPPTDTPIVSPPANGCGFTKPDGETVVVEDGDSFGNLMEGICGSSSDWPFFCNSEVGNTISRQSPDNAEYPYCIFDNTASGTPICARTNEQVTFEDDNGIDMICSCLYLNIALGGAQSTCRPIDDSTLAPTMAPTQGMAPKGSSAFATSWIVAMICTMIMTFRASIV